MEFELSDDSRHSRILSEQFAMGCKRKTPIHALDAEAGGPCFAQGIDPYLMLASTG